MQLSGHEYLKQTRAYCDYLEEHFNNIARAFDEVYSKCKHLPFFADDYNYHTLYNQVEYHDLSKFMAEEFTQYRNQFFPAQGVPTIEKANAFTLAWIHHYSSNRHHWESAVNDIDVMHMIIDWTAMSYKFGGTAQSYYEANQHKIKLNSNLIEFMHTIFNYLKDSHEHTNQHGAGTAEQSTCVSKWPDIYEQH